MVGQDREQQDRLNGQLTRISFCLDEEPALRNKPSTSIWSMIRAHASDTNAGIRH